MPILDFYQRGPDRPWANPQLVTAAIVGHTTETTTRLWVRVWAPAEYCLLVADTAFPPESKIQFSREGGKVSVALKFDKKVISPQAFVASFSFDTDLTHVFDVGSLQPGAEYFYALFPTTPQQNPWEIPPDKELRKFRTRPKRPTEVAFGLYSCHMPYTGSGNIANTHMWEQFARELEDYKAGFVIGGGDQVYTDGNDRVSIWRWLKKVKRDMPKSDKECIRIMRSWYRDIYRGYWGIPQVRRLFERFPNYMIWDDHEIKDGWGSYTRKELADELDSIFEWQNSKLNLRLADLMFEAAKLTYHEYEHSHNPATEPGVYDYSFDWGVFPFYVLDMRGDRDFNRKTKDKVLGADQMRRFLKWFESPAVRKAPAIFIVSPVPIVHIANFVVNHMDIALLGVADDLRDEWEHKKNWAERNVILDAVFRQSHVTQQQVVFLSGDVHVAAAFKLFRTESAKARVYQLTSSGITYAAGSALGKFALKLAVRKNGELGDSKARMKHPTSFRLLHTVLLENNFGIVDAKSGEKGAEIQWCVYGNTGEPDKTAKMTAVKLD